jgi:hypothetical protein
MSDGDRARPTRAAPGIVGAGDVVSDDITDTDDAAPIGRDRIDVPSPFIPHLPPTCFDPRLRSTDAPRSPLDDLTPLRSSPTLIDPTPATAPSSPTHAPRDCPPQSPALQLTSPAVARAPRHAPRDRPICSAFPSPTVARPPAHSPRPPRSPDIRRGRPRSTSRPPRPPICSTHPPRSPAPPAHSAATAPLSSTSHRLDAVTPSLSATGPALPRLQGPPHGVLTPLGAFAPPTHPAARSAKAAPRNLLSYRTLPPSRNRPSTMRPLGDPPTRPTLESTTIDVRLTPAPRCPPRSFTTNPLSAVLSTCRLDAGRWPCAERTCVRLSPATTTQPPFREETSPSSVFSLPPPRAVRTGASHPCPLHLSVRLLPLPIPTRQPSGLSGHLPPHHPSRHPPWVTVATAPRGPGAG